jgi:LSD1 subclass zinc finger protein
MGFNEKTAAVSNMLKCEGCGAGVNFEPGAQQLKCAYCGTKKEINAAAEKKDITGYSYYDFADSITADQLSPYLQSVKCTNCGSKSVLAKNVTAGKCSFCSSPLVIDLNDSQQYVKPHYVLPFAVTSLDAKEAFKTWLKQLSFAPADLIKQVNSSASTPLDGVYLPYWIYDVATLTKYNGSRGDYYYVTETYIVKVNDQDEWRTREVRHTNWTSVFGTVSNLFANLVIPASKSLSQKTIDSLGKWDFNMLMPYDEGYLSGFRAESFQISPQEGLVLAEAGMPAEIKKSIKADIGGDEQQITDSDMRVENANIKYVLLPVWISSYTYKNKPYQFTINACTGRVSGKRPWSPGKIIMWIVIGLAVIGAIIYYFNQ